MEAALLKQGRKVELAAASLRASLSDAGSTLKQLEELVGTTVTWSPEVDAAAPAAQHRKSNGAAAPGRGPHAAPASPLPRATVAPSAGNLGKCARALLAALVQHGDQSLQQAAIVGMYPPNAAIVEKSAGQLRKLGLVVGPNALLSVTPEGRRHREMQGLEAFPVGPELAEYWLGRLGKCEAGLLREVLRRHPKPVALEHAATASGYPGLSPIVEKSAGRLRKLMLVDGSNAALSANERLVS
jgi:hypothetical protein